MRTGHLYEDTNAKVNAKTTSSLTLSLQVTQPFSFTVDNSFCLLDKKKKKKHKWCSILLPPHRMGFYNTVGTIVRGNTLGKPKAVYAHQQVITQLPAGCKAPVTELCSPGKWNPKVYIGKNEVNSRGTNSGWKNACTPISRRKENEKPPQKNNSQKHPSVLHHKTVMYM